LKNGELSKGSVANAGDKGAEYPAPDENISGSTRAKARRNAVGSRVKLSTAKTVELKHFIVRTDRISSAISTSIADIGMPRFALPNIDVKGPEYPRLRGENSKSNGAKSTTGKRLSK